jgi:hypothetical protein
MKQCCHHNYKITRVVHRFRPKKYIESLLLEYIDLVFKLYLGDIDHSPPAGSIHVLNDSYIIAFQF